MDRPEAPDTRVHRPGAGRRHGLWLATMAMLVAAGPVAAGFSDSGSRRAGGLIVDLAVVPANFVPGHSPEQTGQGMHGGPSTSRYSHHLIVAVFESRSGLRVTDATVMVVVSSSHHPIERRSLEPMALGGAATYGGDMVALDARRLSAATQ